MSAWYIFTALGFYPVDPSSGDYVLGVPQVESAEIRLRNGHRVTIKRAENIDLSKPLTIHLNGENVGKRAISHNQLTAGGELAFH